MFGITVHCPMKSIVLQYEVKNVIKVAVKDTRNVFVYAVWFHILWKFCTFVRVDVKDV